jgi:hypothetical protein
MNNLYRRPSIDAYTVSVYLAKWMQKRRFLVSEWLISKEYSLLKSSSQMNRTFVESTYGGFWYKVSSKQNER